VEAKTRADIVILVSRGDRQNIDDCLRSIQSNCESSLLQTVYVVDNASADGTVGHVESSFPWVEVILIGRNAGFAVANNVALRRGTAPYALVLNPDTEFQPGALAHMLELMESRRDIGVAGCRLVREDGTFDHAAKRSFPTIVGALGHFTGVGRRDDSARAFSQYRAPDVGEFDSAEVDAVNGAFMLVRRTAMNQVGLLDEGYWIYGEDLDWCYRFKRAGWSVWYEGSVSVVHKKAGTTGTYRKLRTNAAFHHAMARYYRKFHAGDRPLLDLAVFTAITAKFVASVARSAVVRTIRKIRVSNG
jgi:GT2 family glycosyltransferase